MSTGRSRRVAEARVYVGPLTAVIIERGWLFVYAMNTGRLMYAYAIGPDDD